MNKHTVFCICSESSGGKDHLFKRLIKETNLKPVISHTTRPKREGESNDTYCFITDEEFDKMIANDEFIEQRTYKTEKGTWRYGMSKKALKSNEGFRSLVILDINGLKELEQAIGKRNIYSIYLTASPTTRLLRAINRQKVEIDREYISNKDHQTLQEIVRRYYDDAKVFSKANQICNITLKNETLEDQENNITCIKNLL